MRVYIWAAEGTYQGLHGVEDMWVGEVEDIEEAMLIGSEMSYEVMERYGLEPDWDEDEECYVFDLEDVYAIFNIKDDVTLSNEELNRECCRLGDRLFRKEYCDGSLDY